MIYTELTKKALALCFLAHKEQTDKTGLPYVFHPFHLAESMTDEATTCVALLHDIVEDTDMTLDSLSELGFPKEYVEAIGLMTHAPEVPYMDYVREIKKNPIARAVKIADLTHNSDMTRLDTVDDYAIARAEKYKRALEILLEE
jgi:(p)ppGpp synthase/HD superfamily hydrolase